MNKDRGQGLVEYLILVCLVAVAAMGVVSVVGANVSEHYVNVSNALRGKKKIRTTAPTKDSYEARGMHDYMEAVPQE